MNREERLVFRNPHSEVVNHNVIAATAVLYMAGKLARTCAQVVQDVSVATCTRVAKHQGPFGLWE